MALAPSTTVKNTAEVAKATTQLVSNKNTANTSGGLTVSVQAINVTEIARGQAALISNYGSNQ